ncbi:MAG: T9SS type A sorting domain-containing protein [Bacteroidales bacterium]|nr:T9SS type A sorting domain-containing protein [Bacteroidales bacterium]
MENGAGIGIDYIKDFKIGINPEDFVAVTDIINVPTEGIIKIPLFLTGTVVPANATYKSIVWKVSDAGSTGAYISGVNTLNIESEGTAIVSAIVANGLGIGIEYTQDFNITVKGIPEEIPEISQPNPLKAYTQNRILYVSGLTVGETWRVYDILGKLVYQGVATDETANTILTVSGVYIIRSGSKTAKVVVH